jgi:hypothetical protein
MYLYLDESGDLGFNFKEKRSSEKFVITILVCFNEASRREFRKAVQRTIKNKVNKNRKKQKVQELKGTNTDINIKKYFLRNVENDDWKVFSLVLNKRRVYKELSTPRGKKKLYNFLSRVLIEKLAPILQKEKEKVELIVDKSKSKEEIKDFNQYLENQLDALLPLNVPLYIYHRNSFETFELQAVDLFCWGIFRKFEIQDIDWYQCFSHKIECEMEYLK